MDDEPQAPGGPALDPPAPRELPAGEPAPTTPNTLAGVTLGTGAVAALVAALGLLPVLVNAEGPFGSHAGIGGLATAGSALVIGTAVALLVRAAARRSTAAGVGVVVGLAAITFVLHPTPVDRHESFVEQPNERSSCLGVTFRHYPPNTFDASSVVYCIGLERELPVG